MTVLHSGSTTSYSDNWSKAFGKKTGKKKTAAPKEKNTAPKKKGAAKKKSTVRKKSKAKKR